MKSMVVPNATPNPQVELTVKQRSRCLIPVMLRMPAAAHLQRSASQQRHG